MKDSRVSSAGYKLSIRSEKIRPNANGPIEVFGREGCDSFFLLSSNAIRINSIKKNSQNLNGIYNAIELPYRS